jgi:hypothetical protein
LTSISRIKELESIQFEEETMRITTIIALFVILLAGTAFAGDNGNGCKLQGTWIGEIPYLLPDDTPLDPTDDVYYMLKLFVTYNGTGDNEGTEFMDWINPVPPPGHSWSNARGIWKKVGPNMYSWTAYGYEFDDATGDIVYILRHGGIKHLMDCNTIEATDKVEYLDSDMNPLMCIDGGTVTVHRILMQEPCEPSPPTE